MLLCNRDAIAKTSDRKRWVADPDGWLAAATVIPPHGTARDVPDPLHGYAEVVSALAAESVQQLAIGKQEEAELPSRHVSTVAIVLCQAMPFVSTDCIDPDDEALTNKHWLSFMGVPLWEGTL